MTRILVLDDRPINRQFLTTLLQYKNYETREAADGVEGLEVVRGWLPDLAIVDIDMPGMNGVDFVRHVKADQDLASIAIIFYTASYDAVDAAQMARECGVTHVLMKPSEPELILETIDKALGQLVPRPRAAVAEAAAAQFVRLHSDALRMSSLIELQFEVAAQRRPGDILDILVRAARHIVPARHAIVTMFDGHSTFSVSSSTEEPGSVRAEAAPPLEVVKRLLDGARPVRTTRYADPAACAMWSTDAETVLGVPLQTASGRHGWLVLLDRDGVAEFSVEDERIAQTIAAQAAVSYDNLLLFEQLRREADALDRNVNLLRATIESTGDGILVIDNELRLDTFNQRFVDMWQVPDHLLRSRDGRAAFQHALTQVKDPKAFRPAEHFATHGREESQTVEMIDGRILEGHAAPRRLGRDVVGRVWSFRDVTARVRAEEALRTSEEKYRSLIANIPDVTWTADVAGDVTFVSSNVRATYGFTAEEFCANGGEFWRSRIHHDDVGRVMARYERLFASGEEFDVEYRVQARDGSWIWVHDRSVSTYQRNGVAYADGVMHDVSARKEAEAELTRVARERALLLESTGDGIYAIDKAGRCTMANHVAATLLGRTNDDLLGERAHELIHYRKSDGAPYPAETCAIYRAFSSARPVRVTDEVFWRKDGSSFPVEYLASPIIDDGAVRGVVVTFSDVSERRRLERRLEQIDRIDSLGRMAATIAHEFNNVLMGIQPFGEVIRNRSTNDPIIQQSANQILSSVTRGKTITQDILRMSKAAEPAFQTIDLTEWLDELVSEIRALAGPGVMVNLEAPPRGALFARCDPSQMQQVLTNLALNARDAMPRGGTLTITARRHLDSVQLRVTDTGSGIAPETLPFVFEPLFTTKHSGTGLGLAVARQVVVRNGGTINVESTVAQGTAFEIDLPAVEPDVTSAALEQPSSARDLRVRRIVVVEDDAMVAAGITAMLEAEDIEVRVVSLGRDAMSVVEVFRPDVVLIDISLPDMSGTDVYELIAARWPQMRVIFSTGHAEESRVPGTESKHVAFLRKPYSSEMLMEKLADVIA